MRGMRQIQYPAHILKTELSPESFKAGGRVRARRGFDPGGEPLNALEIEKIVEGLVARKKYIYLCTNGSS